MSYIKLHRKILDNGVFADAELLKVFVWCILKANSKDAIVYDRSIKAGQFITGRVTAAEELRLKPSTVYNRMKRLQTQGYIKIDSNTKNSVVTVIKYKQYQYNETPTKTPILDRYNAFSMECSKHTQTHNQTLIDDFIEYWTEPSRSGSKMRFEIQKTFSVPHRLRTWSKNSRKFNKADKKSSVETCINSWQEARDLI